MTKDRIESESKEEVLQSMKKHGMDPNIQSMLDLPKTIDSPKALKTIRALLNALLWLPFRAADAVQFALAPAKALFDHRKLKRNSSSSIEGWSYLSP